MNSNSLTNSFLEYIANLVVPNIRPQTWSDVIDLIMDILVRLELNEPPLLLEYGENSFVNLDIFDGNFLSGSIPYTQKFYFA